MSGVPLVVAKVSGIGAAASYVSFVVQPSKPKQASATKRSIHFRTLLTGSSFAGSRVGTCMVIKNPRGVLFARKVDQNWDLSDLLCFPDVAQLDQGVIARACHVAEAIP